MWSHSTAKAVLSSLSKAALCTKHPQHWGCFFMSQALQEQVTRALTAQGFTTERGKCQKFVRQNIQKVYGGFFDDFHKGSAKESARAWSQSKWYLVGSHPSIPGDILYYTSADHGEYGHVAVRVLGNQVAENSTYHFERTGDGRGKRPLLALGTPSLIVRLPEPFRILNRAHND